MNRCFDRTACRRTGITLLLGVCLSYPMILQAAETDLSVQPAADAPAPMPTVATNAEAASTEASTTQTVAEISAQFAASKILPVSAVSNGDTPTPSSQPAAELPAQAELAPEADSAASVADEPVSGADSHDMPTPQAEVEFADDMPTDPLAPLEAAADNSQPSPKELSVEPGNDPLQPKSLAPKWIAATPQLDGETHTLVVASMASSKRVRVEKELDMPLCRTVIDYVNNDLADGDTTVDLSRYVTADFIRKNLIDVPEGYVEEISTSKGPMFQKWVQVNITPEQQAQLKRWHTEAVQAKRLPPIGIALAGLLGLIGVTHVVLRRRHPVVTATAVTESEAQPAAHRPGFMKAVFGLGILGLGVVGIGLVGSLFVARTVVVQEKMAREQVYQAQEMAVQAQAQAEAARDSARAKIRANRPQPPAAPDLPNADDIFTSPQDPATLKPLELQDQSGPALPEGSVTTTISKNGNQQIIIRTRTK